MMAREASKTRKWEKDRRDRLKDAFNELSKVLPCYNPSVTLVKIDILTKAASHIKELQEKVNALVSPKSNKKDEVEDDFIKKLQDRIKKLLIRNEQLCSLLKEANISVPTVCGIVKKFKSPQIWSNKINPERAKLLQKRELEKQNRKTPKKKVKTPTTTIAPKHRKQLVRGEKKIRPSKSKKNARVPSSSSKCLIVFSQPSVTQPCYIITNTPSNAVIQGTSTTGTTVSSNSTILTTPLASSNVKPYSTTVLAGTNSTLSSLGPGTLILANGTILPVLPQTSNIVPSTPTIISNNLNPTPNLSNLIVVSNIPTTLVNSITVSQTSLVNNILQKKSITNYKPVKPKICLTRTTQVNKVPIPALTSRYANNYIVLNSSQKQDTNKIKPKSIIKKSKDVKTVNTEKKTEQSKLTEINTEKRKSIDFENEVPAKKSKIDSPSKTNNISNSKYDRVDEEKIVKADSKSCQLTEVINTNENTKNINTASTGKSDSVVEINSEKNISHSCMVDNLNNSEDVITKNTECKSDLPSSSANANAVEDCSISVPTNLEGPMPISNITDVPIESDQMTTISNHVDVNSKKETEKNTSETADIPELNENTENEMKTLEINLPHSELSNDIFASLQVPPGCQNPESTSPTAAFLLTFPLVSSLNGVKVTEVIDEENSESQRGTPNLLQIGTMVNTKTTSSQSDALTPSLLNLDNFSFFTGKDFSASFCNSYTPTCTTASSTVTTSDNTKVANTIFTTSTTTSSEVKSITDTKTKVSHVSKNSVENLPQKEPCNSSKQKIAYNSTNPFLERTGCTSSSVNMQPISHVLPSYNKSHPAEQTIQKNIENKHQFISQNKSYVSTDISNFPIMSETCTTKVNTTCSYANIPKSYCNPLTSNNNAYNYNYHSDANFNQNYYKSISKNDNRSYYPLPHYENYPDYKKNDAAFSSNYYNPQSFSKDKFNNSPPKVRQTVAQSKPPINWMTTPDNKVQTDYLLPPLNKESEFNHNTIYPSNSFVCNSHTTYFTTNSMYSTSDICGNITDNRKTLDLPLPPPINNNFQRTDIEEWSPTKMPQFLDPLVGDLGLNTHIFEQKNEVKCNKDRPKESRRAKTNNYDNQTNFLSVSQLVDTNKTDSVPARTTTRRNSGNRCKSNQQSKQKRKSQETKDSYSLKNDMIKQPQMKIAGSTNYSTQNNHEMFCENKTVPKNSSNNYSAEALIGHSNHNMQSDLAKKQNYSTNPKSLPVPPFLTDNIIPYFPPVEFTQENNYMQQNQNYSSNTFGHNFNTFQNNTYTANSFMPSASTITTTYIPTNNFVHDSHDFISDNFNLFPNTTKDKHFGKNQTRHVNSNTRDEKSHNISCSNNYKKPKKKSNNEGNLPGFDIQFLSMPGNRNSPLLPDDFHTHTSFLPPTTPYKSMNPLYHKQNPDITPTSLLPLPPVPGSRNGNQPEISPSINSAGTSLTNFNLSTIFPEINKGPMSDLYRDSRNKDNASSRNYNVTTSSIQVPFSNKSTFNFSYNQ